MDDESQSNIHWGQTIKFPREVASRYYRLEFVWDRTKEPFIAPQRFEIADLTLLRSPNHCLVPPRNEVLQLKHVEVRLQGKGLADDYAYVNGTEIMDLTLESSVRGQAYEPMLTLRSLLDVRERTQAQFIVNPRSTRAKCQTFYEHTNPTKQRLLSITRQQMRKGVESERAKSEAVIGALGIDPKKDPVSKWLDAVMSKHEGIVTDRDYDPTRHKKDLEIDLAEMLMKIGVDATKFLEIINELTDEGNFALRSGVSNIGVPLGDIITPTPTSVFPSIGAEQPLRISPGNVADGLNGPLWTRPSSSVSQMTFDRPREFPLRLVANSSVAVALEPRPV